MFEYLSRMTAKTERDRLLRSQQELAPAELSKKRVHQSPVQRQAQDRRFSAPVLGASVSRFPAACIGVFRFWVNIPERFPEWEAPLYAPVPEVVPGWDTSCHAHVFEGSQVVSPQLALVPALSGVLFRPTSGLPSDWFKFCQMSVRLPAKKGTALYGHPLGHHPVRSPASFQTPGGVLVLLPAMFNFFFLDFFDLSCFLFFYTCHGHVFVVGLKSKRKNIKN